VQRSINGPDKDWLTADEAAAWMGIAGSTLEDLVVKRRFPPGVRVTGRRRMWSWMDCVAYMHLRSRIPETSDEETVDDEEPPVKRKPTEKS